MKSMVEILAIQTSRDTELINITPLLRKVVGSAGISNGLAHVMTMHTTTAITVNEGLPDLEEDIITMLSEIIPQDKPYRHARFLHADGQMAVNAPSHLRGAVLGMQAIFPVSEGSLIIGERQTVYLVELDGPQRRNIVLQVLGE